MSIPGSCGSCMAGTAFPVDMNKHRPDLMSQIQHHQLNALKNETLHSSVADL